MSQFLSFAFYNVVVGGSRHGPFPWLCGQEKRLFGPFQHRVLRARETSNLALNIFLGSTSFRWNRQKLQFLKLRGNEVAVATQVVEIGTWRAHSAPTSTLKQTQAQMFFSHKSLLLKIYKHLYHLSYVASICAEKSITLPTAKRSYFSAKMFR